MSGLYVDPENMNTQGMNTVTYANDFLNEINLLTSNTESLMEIWSGDAATAFKVAEEAQIVNLKDFEKDLELLGEKIIQGSRNFTSTEEEIASNASNLY